MAPNIKVVISNGSYKFHLAPLASEMAKLNKLAAFFTAGYPKGIIYDILKTIPNKSFQRFVNRRENINDDLVYSFSDTELYFKLADTIFRRFSQKLEHKVQIMGFERYSNEAMKVLEKIQFDIYHYRDCYGLKSAKWVQEQGKKTICDHSIGHPYAISYILNNNEVKSLPTIIHPQPLNLLETYFLKDFNYADAILVNSNFVKETFASCGYNLGNIHVVYLGVDNQFLEKADEVLLKKIKRKSSRELLFCGQWGQRKGALQIMDALELLEDESWTLTIAGGIDPQILPRWKSFANRFRDRINYLGILTRNELVEIMTRHQVFIFPSLMEGSARVVFEALSCGCFVITTPNSGSIVEEGVSGTIVEVASVISLANALLKTWSHNYDLYSTSLLNQELVRTEYRQDKYAYRVLQVYDKVLNS